MKYERILLKLSGEALMGQKQFGVDPPRIAQYAEDIKEVVNMGVQVSIVIGGGNIYRGLQAEENGIERVQGDYMGMLATMINGMALQSALEKIELQTRLMSALKMEEVAESYIRRRAIRHLEKSRVVIFGAGTGNPYFTTDTAASLRAIEVEADAIFKGTRVNGVYSSDPEKNIDAERFSELSFRQAYQHGLSIMDLTAFTLCQENNLPILVFNMNEQGTLQEVIKGKEGTGTLVSNVD